ncbi:MAG: MFS transporter [Candidatus Eremiobacteraeota bacterium]|nr:MFS transporter [Candidatus Eremiobacteraeota bacterium]MBC5828200.1 MFS transporter [Candidatus Eremiobacteraeota bacterium]
MSVTVSRRAWLTQTVLAIGIASLLADACYEGIIPLLPALVTSLGGGAAALGLIEGLADGLAAVFKLWGGTLADRTAHRRAWTAGGYFGLGIFMPAIALAASIPAVLAFRSLAWICRGFRSPIRDTLLVDDTDPAFVNRAFGFQRALDTVGAVIGPAAAMAMVAAHVPVRTAIAFGLIPGLLAGVLYFFVRERPRTVPPRQALHIALAGLPNTFKRYLVGAGIFGVGNFSQTLLVLVAIHALTPRVGAVRAIIYATAFYLMHNIVQAALSYPAGVFSEKVGSGRLLVASFCGFAIVSGLVAVGSASVLAVGIAFAVSAMSTAVLEPMEGTFATELLPAERRGTGFGALAAVNSVGDFASSAGVGLLWQAFGAPLAFAVAAAVCIAGAAIVLPIAARRNVAV